VDNPDQSQVRAIGVRLSGYIFRSSRRTRWVGYLYGKLSRCGQKATYQITELRHQQGMKFPACSTDTPRSRRATRSLPTLRRASPYRDGASNQGKEVCSFRTLACRWLSRSNRVPYRSVDYNRAQDTKTSSKSPQESVSDVAFPERGSFEDRGKGTTE
jgi:hypothetical protein